ncbi:DNA polymerase Y family protein [Kiritimatiella glycovorans]|uniref:DNA polymerase IV n=1 Tax=Kiritimatiella glycovorans TaxID=1307763 RepID=A0A0G3EJE4_9BACT|nr:DNA polymerase IV [Kiritimatiella glycovorans]AKJ64900.1 DNA polymerase IV [Kiritimatiella glycovorans]
MSPSEQPLMLKSFPRAILHVDGDAFFTSVEQALHPELRGRPVVSGRERGIIACASYEAKALGIRRGVALHEARRRCPELVVLPSDYETYSLFSKRMFAIMRQYSPAVEEYSIDEGFADLTGVRRVFRASYPQIAAMLQEQVRRELGITVSLGLAPSKSLAKIASDYRKPEGLTPVAGRHIHHFLPRVPLEDVWGFGKNTVELFRKHGLETAWDFVQRPERWAARMMGKAGREIWRELRGEAVCAVETEAKPRRCSISKCKTFTEPSADADEVRARLLRNLESAFIKLRRHRMKTREIAVFLRRRDYHERGWSVRLNRATGLTREAVPHVRAVFDQLFQPGTEYRATTVVLTRLEPDAHDQFELFDDPLQVERARRLTKAVDRVNARYGKHKVALGASLYLPKAPRNDREDPAWRKAHLLRGESARRRLALPRMDVAC